MILSLYKIAFLNSNTTILQNIDDYNYFVNNKIIKASRCKIIPGSGLILIFINIISRIKQMIHLIFYVCQDL